MNFYGTRLFLPIFLANFQVQTLKPERLIGGRLSETCEFKHQVVIKSSGDAFLCGGSIIDDRYVVTAAHCVRKTELEYGYENLTVIIGYDGLEDENYTEIKADIAYIPAEFNEKTTVGDIGVIKLSNSLKVDENPCLTKLRLPTSDDYEGKNAVVSGQGIDLIDWHIDVFEVLRFETNHTARSYILETKIISNSECQSAYEFGFMKLAKIRDGELCAKPIRIDSSEEEKGTCDGDSGSALIVNNTIVGIVSSGARFCDDTIYYGIYTRVFYYLEFIKKALENDVDCTLIHGPSTDYLDLCLVKTNTYEKDFGDLSFFTDYDLLPYYNEGISNFLSYVKYSSVKLGERFSQWWKKNVW